MRILLWRVSEKHLRSISWYIFSQDLIWKLVTNRESRFVRHKWVTSVSQPPLIGPRMWLQPLQCSPAPHSVSLPSALLFLMKCKKLPVQTTCACSSLISIVTMKKKRKQVDSTRVYQDVRNSSGLINHLSAIETSCL